MKKISPRLIIVLIVVLFLVLLIPALLPARTPAGPAPTEAPALGWITDGSGTRYGTETGFLTGWQQLDGKAYHFSADGVMDTGWLEEDGQRFYLLTSGELVTGWYSMDGAEVYFKEDGALASGPVTVDGVPCIFREDGTLASGWLQLENRRYYADPEGRAVTGWQEVDGITRYFLEDGQAAAGEIILDGEVRRFGSNGQEIILANPWNAIPDWYETEVREITPNQSISVVCYEDLKQMMADCDAAGNDVAICSGYRSHAAQEYLFQNKINRVIKSGVAADQAPAVAAMSVAVPGTSEHELGLAADLIDNRNWRLDASQADTPTQKWLMENCWRYGFILRYPDGTSDLTGIIFEPWHYRYVGKELSEEIHRSGMCLEEYLASLTESAG